MTDTKQYIDALNVEIKTKFPLELFRHTLGFVHDSQIPYDQEDMFITACVYGSYDIVEYFLSIGIDPNNRDNSFGSIAIIYAVLKIHINMYSNYTYFTK